MSERIEGKAPESVCTLTFDFSKEVKPLSDRAKVCLNMLMLQDKVSVNDLTRITGLQQEVVIEEIKFLKKEFDLRGGLKRGFTLSDDPMKRVAMSTWMETQY